MLPVMSSFTFLHAADLHLDSPLRGLDPDAPAARIRGATRAALENLVQLAIEQRVAFVLFAGDLFDGDSKDWRTGQFLVQQLGRLRRAGIEVAAISGNHDAEQVITHKLSIPGMLAADRPGTILLDGVPVAVHGQSFATREEHTNLARTYPARHEDRFNIGLLHTACGSGAHANYAPCSIEDLVRHGYEYWALGHVHTREILSRDPWIVFPGNIQGRQVKEEGSKGATLVTVQDGRVVDAVHHPLDVLRFRRLAVGVTGAAGMDAVLTRVRMALHEEVLLAEGRMLAVRVILRGDTPAHAQLSRSYHQTLADVRAAAADEVADTDALWIESVRVETRPAMDLDAMRAQPGAVGALIRALDGPAVLEKGLVTFAEEQLKRTDGVLDPDHPAYAIAAGQVPEDILARARAIVLAELARG